MLVPAQGRRYRAASELLSDPAGHEAFERGRADRAASATIDTEGLMRKGIRWARAYGMGRAAGTSSAPAPPGVAALTTLLAALGALRVDPRRPLRAEAAVAAATGLAAARWQAVAARRRTERLGLAAGLEPQVRFDPVNVARGGLAFAYAAWWRLSGRGRPVVSPSFSVATQMIAAFERERDWRAALP